MVRAENENSFLAYTNMRGETLLVLQRRRN